MKTLNEKANQFFFMGFRERFLQENADATTEEIEQAFQKFKRTDELFVAKLKIVKFFVMLGMAIKYIVPGAVLAGLAIWLDVDRVLLG